MEKPTSSRRQFIAATAKLASASWVAMHWPQIALAAEHDGHAGHDMTAPPATIKTLTAAEAAFLPLEDRAELVDRIRGGFETV